RKVTVFSITTGVSFGSAAVGRPHIGQLIRLLEITCSNTLQSATFPADGQFCAIAYTETKLSRKAGVTKSWSRCAGAVHVTLPSFDGTHLVGRFDGVLPPFLGSDTSLTIENGTFSLVAAQ